MIRTIISFDEQDKSWLDRKAQESGVSMAEIVRDAVHQMQKRERKSLDQLLDSTRNTWSNGDGLRYQRRLRREWK